MNEFNQDLSEDLGENNEVELDELNTSGDEEEDEA